MFTSKLRRAKKTEGHRSSAVSRTVSWLTAGTVAICAAAITTFGGSYALLNSTATVNAGTITSATPTITVVGSSLSFGTQPLAAGQSAVATAVVKNENTYPLAVSAAVDTKTVADSKGMAAQSRLGATAVSDSKACTTTAVADPTAALATFSTPAGSPLITLPADSSTTLCFKLKLDAAAPISVQGGTTSFTVMLQGNQVAQ